MKTDKWDIMALIQFYEVIIKEDARVQLFLLKEAFYSLKFSIVHVSMQL